MGLTPPPLHGDDLFDEEGETGSGLDLHAVCEQAVSRVRDELHAKQPIQMEFGPMAQVAAPRGDFFQVMVNILLNAEDVARRLDAELGRVLLSTHGGADHAIVLVRASIPPPARARSTPGQPGAGVRWEHFGMPVCQKILSSFGGTLSLETDETTGTTFRVTVPVPRRTVIPPVAQGAEGAPPPSLLRIPSAPLSQSKIVTPSASFPSGGPLPTRKHTKEFAVVIPPKKKG